MGRLIRNSGLSLVSLIEERMAAGPGRGPESRVANLYHLLRSVPWLQGGATEGKTGQMGTEISCAPDAGRVIVPPTVIGGSETFEAQGSVVPLP